MMQEPVSAQTRDALCEYIASTSWDLYVQAEEDSQWSHLLSQMCLILDDIDPADPRLVALATVDLGYESLAAFRSYVDGDWGSGPAAAGKLLTRLLDWLARKQERVAHHSPQSGT